MSSCEFALSEFNLLYKVAGKHKGIPRHIDFTIDSVYMRSSDDEEGVIYLKSKGQARLGQVEADILRYPHEVKDNNWFSNSCPT